MKFYSVYVDKLQVRSGSLSKMAALCNIESRATKLSHGEEKKNKKNITFIPDVHEKKKSSMLNSDFSL